MKESSAARGRSQYDDVRLSEQSSPCGELSGTDAVKWNPKLRGEVEAALPSRQEAFDADSDDDEARRAYAEVLFKLGDIWEADEVIAPLGTTSSCHAGDLRLAAKRATPTPGERRSRNLSASPRPSRWAR